jgi:hypothetical protein
MVMLNISSGCTYIFFCALFWNVVWHLAKALVIIDFDVMLS